MLDLLYVCLVNGTSTANPLLYFKTLTAITTWLKWVRFLKASCYIFVRVAQLARAGGPNNVTCKVTNSKVLPRHVAGSSPASDTIPTRLCSRL